MAKRFLTTEDVLARLEAAVADAGGAKAYAANLQGQGYRISEQFISAVRRRKAEPSTAILTPLGLRRVTVFEEDAQTGKG